MLAALLTLLGVGGIVLFVIRAFQTPRPPYLVRDVKDQQVLIDAEDDEMLADAVSEVLRTGRPVVANRDEHGNVTIRVLGNERRE